MRYIIITFTNLAKFQAKQAYDHIAEKDSPAENCMAICASKNILRYALNILRSLSKVHEFKTRRYQHSHSL